MWSGLGYNRRALNLHGAARTIVADHAGAVPGQDDALRALPGVGPYTARAVRSFAFGEDVAAVDTNAVRVLTRCVSGSPLTLRAATDVGDRLVPAGLSWEFNQAMFDLGATVCTAARPDVRPLPMRRQCAWRRAGPGCADPWRTSPSTRAQSRFAGSDRQGRGRLLDQLRRRRRGDDRVGPRLWVARGRGAGRPHRVGAGGRRIRAVVRRSPPRPRAPLTAGPRRTGHSSAAAARGQEAVRNSMMRAFTSSGRSRWRKCPASSTISNSEPAAMKSRGDPMEESNMQPSSRPCR